MQKIIRAVQSFARYSAAIVHTQMHPDTKQRAQYGHMMSTGEAICYIKAANDRILKIIGAQARSGDALAKQIVRYSRLATYTGSPYEGMFLGAFQRWLNTDRNVLAIRAAAAAEQIASHANDMRAYAVEDSEGRTELRVSRAS